jgi:hypothetical protein
VLLKPFSEVWPLSVKIVSYFGLILPSRYPLNLFLKIWDKLEDFIIALFDRRRALCLGGSRCCRSIATRGLSNSSIRGHDSRSFEAGRGAA